MTRYERRVLAVDSDGRVDVQGRILAVLDSPKGGERQITALVEVPETVVETTAPATFEDDSEGVEKTTFFCNEEKSNGEPCTREVDGPNEACWQHQ